MSVREVTTRFIKDAAVTGAKIAAATITNANVSASAAIVYSKLDLTGGITNADVNASAAIAYSKLSLTGSIVNADVNASAAIAYSKLNLSGSIVNADINASAAIAYSKLSLAGSIVVADVATGAKATAATANTFALRDANGRTQFADPSAAADAATKGYVDAVATGLDIKGSVRVVTAAALPAYTRTGNVITADANGALAAVDGVTLSAGNRLLLKDGAAGSDNGIYTVTVVGDGSTPFELTRATDADASAEVTAGMFTFVEEGTNFADTGWVLSTNDPITLNTTSLAFTQFSSSGVVTASGVLTKTGNNITHNTSGVSNGSYTFPNITVDTYGHLTAASSKAFARASAAATNAQTTITTAANVVNESEIVIIEGVMLDKAAGDYSINYTTGDITLSTGMTTGERYFVHYMA